MTEKKNVWLTVLTAICIIYISARFWNLTDSCLWFDEIFSVHAAEIDFDQLIWFVAQDLIHPPLFYILLKIWIFIGGESLFWLRLFPVLFSIIALVPFYLICQKLKIGLPTIALAFFLFAANGALIKYAQEVRMYSLLLCLSLFSIWLFLRFSNLGKSFWILTIVNVLLIYTYYFGWLIVLSEVAAILILQRIKIRQILTSFGICLLAFAPWIFAIWRASQVNADVNQNLGWAGKPNFSTVFQFVFDLFEPFYFQASNVASGSIYLISVPILVIIIAAIGLHLVEWKSLDEEEKKSLYLLLVFIKTPIIIALIASWLLPFSVWGTRHLIIVFAPFLVLTAIAVSKIKIQIIEIGFISIIISLTIFAFILQINRPQQQFIWCAWENLAGNLESSTLHGENATDILIYTFEDLVAYHFWFALRDSNRNFRVYKIGNTPDLIEDKAYFLPRGFDKIKQINFDDISEPKFYVAFRDVNFSKNHPPLKNLKTKGYKISEPKIIEANGLKAILIEMNK